MTQAARAVWDAEAAAFDDEPDHGLRSPVVRDAWRSLLLGVLPPVPARLADLGCGTGTLSALLAGEGYDVTGLDVSTAMLDRARVKAPTVRFVEGDASAPDLPRASYDVVLCRHVLWALPDPVAAFGRWVDLLAPGGVVVLVEGSWSTGAGLTAEACERIVRTRRAHVEVTHLVDEAYWGRPVTDERYLLISRA